jgi:hypothetical protein
MKWFNLTKEIKMDSLIVSATIIQGICYIVFGMVVVGLVVMFISE